MRYLRMWPALGMLLALAPFSTLRAGADSPPPKTAQLVITPVKTYIKTATGEPTDIAFVITISNNGDGTTQHPPAAVIAANFTLTAGSGEPNCDILNASAPTGFDMTFSDDGSSVSYTAPDANKDSISVPASIDAVVVFYKSAQFIATLTGSVTLSDKTVLSGSGSVTIGVGGPTIDPGAPTLPVDPTDPTDPGFPVDPGYPGDPGDPGDPGAPGAPPGWTGVVWDAGTPIQFTSITAPSMVAPGAKIGLSAPANDADHWTLYNADGSVADSGTAADDLTFAWDCTGGGFIVGYNADGTPQLASTSTDSSPQFVAPSGTGTVTVSCTVDDWPDTILAPDTGTRDDAPVMCTATMQMVDASSQSIQKLQYSTDGDKTWIDVPNSGDTAYPLTVNQGDSVDFQAVAGNSAIPWRDGTPAWGQEADGLIGNPVSVCFTDYSADPQNILKVTATCNNTVTADIYVVRTYSVQLYPTAKDLLAGNGSRNCEKTLVYAAVIDGGGTVFPGATVSFSSSSAPGSSATVSFDNTSAVTDDYGIAVVSLTAGNTLGDVNITATSVVNGHNATGHYTIACDPPNVDWQWGDWSADGTTIPFTLAYTFNGDKLANLNITLTPAGVFTPDGQTHIPDMDHYLIVDSLDSMTDADGNIGGDLRWLAEDQYPGDYQFTVIATDVEIAP